MAVPAVLPTASTFTGIRLPAGQSTSPTGYHRGASLDGCNRPGGMRGPSIGSDDHPEYDSLSIPNGSRPWTPWSPSAKSAHSSWRHRRPATNEHDHLPGFAVVPPRSAAARHSSAGGGAHHSFLIGKRSRRPPSVPERVQSHMWTKYLKRPVAGPATGVRCRGRSTGRRG